MENTNNEVLGVAAAPPPYVVRWSDLGTADQQWIIAPVDANQCRIVNCANGEFMAIGGDGFLVRWERVEDKGQKFSFANRDGEWWNIQAGDDKYVSIVLPWGPGIAKLNTQPLLRSDADVKYQRFKLLPVDEKKPPELEKGEYDPGAIPEIPRLRDFGHYPPERSPFYLIGETVLPATLVHDPSLSDIVLRVKRSPYYILRREQFWDRTQCSGGDPCLYEHDGHTRKQYETEITYGYSKSQSRKMDETTSLKISVEGKVVFGPKISGSISSAIQHDLQIQESTASEYKESIREKATLDVPAEHFMVCNWVLVNRYTLLNMQREEVDSWNATQYGVLISDGYPRKLELGN
jgi:hypothetical protein